MELKWKIHKWDFDPTDLERVEPGPTRFCIMDVHRGTLVTAVAVRVATAFDAAVTGSVGDGTAGDTNPNIGFVSVTNAVITSLGLKNGAGHYLDMGLAGVGANGKLYTEDDTIDLFYIGHESNTVGRLSVIVVYCEIE